MDCFFVPDPCWWLDPCSPSCLVSPRVPCAVSEAVLGPCGDGTLILGDDESMAAVVALRRFVWSKLSWLRKSGGKGYRWESDTGDGDGAGEARERVDAGRGT